MKFWGTMNQPKKLQKAQVIDAKVVAKKIGLAS